MTRDDDKQLMGSAHEVHLRKWMDFGNQFSKTSDLIEKTLGEASSLTEKKTLELSHQFQLLATSSVENSRCMQEIIKLSHSVNINGEEFEIRQISALLKETFMSSIGCILEISKQAMVMIYILDDALKTLTHIEKSIHEIEVINQKTKYLSLNATIEAVRAGEAGESFQVVASEVRELSNDTQTLATNIRSQVTEMSETLINAQNILQQVARIDMSDNILAKERLEVMMEGLVDNSTRLSAISKNVVESVDQSNQSARELISSIQFQDRVQEEFQNIINVVKSLKQVFLKIKKGSLVDYGDIFGSEEFENK
ncbi:MAG: hypothetical protein C0432_03285 [Candidatus Puniceispirillum sp.]|nr:hypothetical protein [Candidatus Pelagibacter sp.]MBA4283297.1 hypothetical protein [Candidatus Puniceispirillum sp.]